MSRMQLDEFAVFGDAITTFGPDAQQKMLLEEMAELQKEVCKWWRGAANINEIAEEIADVQIMLDQMMILFSCAGRVKTFRANKLRRLEQRIMDARVAAAEESDDTDEEAWHELLQR